MPIWRVCKRQVQGVDDLGRKPQLMGAWVDEASTESCEAHCRQLRDAEPCETIGDIR